eukprot:jgi/Botrbrau1/678/Bobra.160_2s0003.1
MDSRFRQPAISLDKRLEKKGKASSKKSALERCSLAFKNLFKRQPEDGQQTNSGPAYTTSIPPGLGWNIQQEQPKILSWQSKWRTPAGLGKKNQSTHSSTAQQHNPTHSLGNLAERSVRVPAPQASAPKRYIHPWKASRPGSAPADESISLKELAARAKPKVDTGRNDKKQSHIPSAPTTPRSQAARAGTSPPNQMLSRLARTDSMASNVSTATAGSTGAASTKSHQTRRGVGGEKDMSLRPVECTRKGLYLATSPGSFYPTPPKRGHEPTPPPRRKSTSPALQIVPSDKSSVPSAHAKPMWRNANAQIAPVSPSKSKIKTNQTSQVSSHTPDSPGQTPTGVPRFSGTQNRTPDMKTPPSQISGQNSGLGPLGQGAQSLSAEKRRRSATVDGGSSGGPGGYKLVPLEIPSPSSGHMPELPHKPEACESPSVVMQQTISIGAGLQVQEGDEDWLMMRATLALNQFQMDQYMDRRKLANLSPSAPLTPGNPRAKQAFNKQQPASRLPAPPSHSPSATSRGNAAVQRDATCSPSPRRGSPPATMLGKVQMQGTLLKAAGDENTPGVANVAPHMRAERGDSSGGPFKEQTIDAPDMACPSTAACVPGDPDHVQSPLPSRVCKSQPSCASLVDAPPHFRSELQPSPCAAELPPAEEACSLNHPAAHEPGASLLQKDSQLTPRPYGQLLINAAMRECPRLGVLSGSQSLQTHRGSGVSGVREGTHAQCESPRGPPSARKRLSEGCSTREPSPPPRAAQSPSHLSPFRVASGQPSPRDIRRSFLRQLTQLEGLANSSKAVANEPPEHHLQAHQLSPRICAYPLLTESICGWQSPVSSRSPSQLLWKDR